MEWVTMEVELVEWVTCDRFNRVVWFFSGLVVWCRRAVVFAVDAAEPVDRLGQTLAQGNVWTPVQSLLGKGNVGAATRRIIVRKRFVDQC